MDSENIQYRDNDILRLQVDCSQSFTDARVSHNSHMPFSVSSLEVLCPSALLISHFVGNIASSDVFLAFYLMACNSRRLVHVLV